MFTEDENLAGKELDDFGINEDQKAFVGDMAQSMFNALNYQYDQYQEDKNKYELVMDVFSHKYLLIVSIFCWISFALCLVGAISAIAQNYANWSQVFILFLPTLISASLASNFAIATNKLYTYRTKDYIRFTKILKRFESGLTCMIVLMALDVILLLCSLIILSLGIGVFEELFSVFADPAINIGNQLFTIITVIFAIIFVVAVFFIFLIAKCKRIVKDAKRKNMDLPSVTPKMQGIGVTLIVLGVLLIVFTILGAISSLVSRGVADQLVSMPVNPLTEVINCLIGIAQSGSLVFGGLFLLQYNKKIKSIYII